VVAAPVVDVCVVDAKGAPVELDRLSCAPAPATRAAAIAKDAMENLQRPCKCGANSRLRWVLLNFDDFKHARRTRTEGAFIQTPQPTQTFMDDEWMKGTSLRAV
jgi:hypothetical protein